jgi:hypothetical protein
VLPSKNLFFHHIRWLRAAAKAAQAEVLLELDSMAAYLRKGDRHWVLYPKFIVETEGVYRYLPRMPEAPMIFGGWLPTPNSGWPATRDKLTFKRLAASLGLPVAEGWLDDSGEHAGVVVKRPAGSFGEDVHGPYRSSRERPLQLPHGEYYERFIEGEIVKAWYWGDRAVVLECDQLPSVVADGISTLRQLIERRAQPAGISAQRLKALLARAADMLRYDGTDLETVPAAGSRHRIDFRYGSELMSSTDRLQVDLRDGAGVEWRALTSTAAALEQLVPNELRGRTMFAVDAIRDHDGRIWLLEMNANPVTHPLVYDVMVAALVANPHTGFAAAPSQAAVAV